MQSSKRYRIHWCDMSPHCTMMISSEWFRRTRISTDCSLRDSGRDSLSLANEAARGLCIAVSTQGTQSRLETVGDYRQGKRRILLHGGLVDSNHGARVESSDAARQALRCVHGFAGDRWAKRWQLKRCVRQGWLYFVFRRAEAVLSTGSFGVRRIIQMDVQRTKQWIIPICQPTIG